MLGNTHLWEADKENGLKAMDFYGRLLRTFPGVLWAFRVVMLVTALLHVITGVRLWLENRRARPVGYAHMKHGQGEPRLANNDLHRRHHHGVHRLPPLAPDPRQGRAVRGRPGLRNVVQGFQIPWISALYIVGQVLLFFHLSHGIPSLFQTLGFNHPKYKLTVERAGLALALVICGINILFPVSVLLGWVKLG